MRETALPLAEAKLMLPRLRPELVARGRVQDALDQDDVRVALVAAPPGYGKTVAARTWYERCPGSVAWVTLDAGDNDPVRFWTYAATAVDRIRGGLGRAALQRLHRVGGTLEGALIELLNGMAAFGDPITIVLDDFQAITDRDCLDSVDYAIEHLPPTTRLIVLTRSDPPLRLPQLRATGALAEIRANDLAFTLAEAHELLVDRGGLPLDEEEVRVLHARTEGWPGALYLALLWLRGLDDPHGAVRGFGGDHRFVADYLNHEILGSLDARARWFLLHTSVLGHFTAELCDEVFARFDSASELQRLEHSNLFVAGLEHGGWYRVHPLFAEFAEFQLAKVDPGSGGEIHRRAARWFLPRGLLAEAVEHAAAAHDHRLVARIIVENHSALITTGGSRTLLRWTALLPEEELRTQPELAVAAATATSLVGPRTIERRRLLQLVQGETTPYVEAGTRLVRALTFDEGVDAAVAQAERAVEIAEAGVAGLLVDSLAASAQALYFAGDTPGASAMSLRAVEHPDAERRPTAEVMARSALALADLDRGLVDAARIHAEKARSLVAGIHSSRSWLGANAYTAVAAVHAAEGKLAEAERELMYAERFFHDEVPTVHHAWLLLLLASTRCRRGRLQEADQALEAARLELQGLDDCGRLPVMAAGVEQELEHAAARADLGEVLETPSEAELAVLRLLASELSAREIGSRLFLSANTVRTHTRAIYRKLGVNSRADAVARATALELLERADRNT